MNFSAFFYNYVVDEFLSRQLDESFMPLITSLKLCSFISYCFDNNFQTRYTKPFTISNYGQKLSNEFELSSFSKNDFNLKKILRELADFAYHHSDTDAEVYITILGYYLDPRILIGFRLRTGIEFMTYYTASRIKKVGNWLNNCIHTTNLDIAKNFCYKQESIFLNYI